MVNRDFSRGPKEAPIQNPMSIQKMADSDHAGYTTLH